MRLEIRGGRVVDPANGIDQVQDLYVADDRVAGVGRVPDGFAAERTIDATNLIVCPGLVDLCARLREPGQEHKATVASETRAAAKSGITTLCCPPDTEPVVDTPAVVELIHQRTNAAANARVEVLGALTKGLAGEQLAEIGALGEAGCVAISNARRPIASTEVMRRALEYATTFGLTVFSHPEDPWLAREGGIHEGAVSARLGLPGIPETAETIAVARDLLLAEQTGATIHFCRLSTRRAVQMVAEARTRGLPVTADVAAHYLYLSQEDTADFDSHCHLRPPLRTQDDRNGLRAGLAEGAITAICSDHQPHELDAKLNPFPDTESGMSALETLVPLAIGLVDANVVGLNRVIGYLTAGPAGIIGQDRGHLSVGAPADICIIDPERRWTLEAQSMLSRGHNTPFLGRTLKGAVLLTLLGGRVVHEEP